MFVSFFPRPFVLTISAVLWGAIAVSFWYMLGSQTGELLGFHLQASATKSVGAAVFWSTQFLWFYLYFVVMVALFASTRMVLSPHPWSRWSILGSALILFTSYFQVQVSVAVNDWYGPFYDLVQAALSKAEPVTLSQFYLQLATFAEIAFVAVAVGVLTRFFVSHYIFRWRTAMNNYYAAHWPQLRTVEGGPWRHLWSSGFTSAFGAIAAIARPAAGSTRSREWTHNGHQDFAIEASPYQCTQLI
jgi:peptide/bleomycin uptake transporter